MDDKNYVSPEVEVFEVEVEKGFEGSSDFENPINGGNI